MCDYVLMILPATLSTKIITCSRFHDFDVAVYRIVPVVDQMEKKKQYKIKCHSLINKFPIPTNPTEKIIISMHSNNALKGILDASQQIKCD